LFEPDSVWINSPLLACSVHQLNDNGKDKMRKTLLAIALGQALLLAGCAGADKQPQATVAAEAVQQNPLFSASQLQYQAPDFSQIRTEHFQPALEAGILAHDKEVQAIAIQSAPPTFENTIVALEKSGALLDRASSVFYNLSSSNSNPEIRRIQSEMAPKMAAHTDNINLNPQLFARINTLYQQRHQLTLTPEQVRLIEVYHQRFVLAGAQLRKVRISPRCEIIVL
jgi:peptidyl-dipeptidase Dcp